MFVSIGQGGNQLASCFWQRAEQHRSSLLRSLPPSLRSMDPPLPLSPFFAKDGRAHAILLDAEPKVTQNVQQMGQELRGKDATTTATATTAAAAEGNKEKQHAQQQQNNNVFRPTNVFAEQYGRGNNWAMGYFGRLGDEGCSGSLLELTLDCIRLEAERLDRFDSLVLLHSLAGGTGSGLGSRITEEIRQSYEKQFILSCCIAPFGMGDTPLQHYNSLLCLSHLYPVSDAVLLASNADIAAALSSPTVQRQLSHAAAAPAMSFAGINTYLSAALADIVAPTRRMQTLKQREQEEARRAQLATEEVNINSFGVTDASSPSSSSASSFASTPASPLLCPPSLHELLSHVTPLPSFKLLEIWSSAGLGSSNSSSSSSSTSTRDERDRWNPSWKSCLDTLVRFVPKSEGSSASAEGNDASSLTLAYTLYARGDSNDDSAAGFFDSFSSRLSRLLPCVSWNPHPLDFVCTTLPRMVWRAPQTGGALAALQNMERNQWNEQQRGVAIAVNRVRTAQSLWPAVEKARVLLENKAYVHWYTRYGVELSEMHAAVDTMESVIQDYQQCDR